jgi:integrase
MVSQRETAAVSVKQKGEPNRWTFVPMKLKHVPIPPHKVSADGQTIVVQKDYWDASTPGFGLRISSSGRRVWTMVARMPHNGQYAVRRFTLGLYAERQGAGGLTLSDARRKAGEYKDAIARGVDPERQKEEAKQQAIRESGQTFEKVAQEFLTLHHPRNKKSLKPSTLRRYTGLLLGPDLAPWQARPLATISRADVVDLLQRMQGRGVTVSANRALAVLRKLMSWAIQRNIIEHSPCDHIQAPAAETPRTRHLFGSRLYNRPSELAMLWRASEAVGPLGALPKLLMLTGQRLCEVAEMQAEELLDLDGSEPRWHIPGARTKNGKDHVLPLTPMTVNILRSLPRLVNCAYLLSTTGTTPMSGFTNFKKRIDREIERLRKTQPTRDAGQFKLPWVFHDLRRTFKTGLAELGIPSDIRDALVNHTPQGVAAHYDHAEHDAAKRAALLKWEGHMLGLVRDDERRSTKQRRG